MLSVQHLRETWKEDMGVRGTQLQTELQRTSESRAVVRRRHEHVQFRIFGIRIGFWDVIPGFVDYQATLVVLVASLAPVSA